MEKKLKVFYDAEFTGLHKDTTPISIGIVSESGAYFYAEFTDYDQSQVTEWIDENVIQKLKLKGDAYISGDMLTPNSQKSAIGSSVNIIVKGDKESISSELMGWLCNESAQADGAQLQFFTDCYAYDWVILNDLIGLHGSALEIPTYVYYIPVDLSTVLYIGHVDPDISREEFIGDYEVQRIRNLPAFSKWSGDPKHNCLWDAYVCQACFNKAAAVK